MGNFRHDLVMRSLGVAVILSLNDKDPQVDYGLLPSFLLEDRPTVVYDAQSMPMVYGPYGTFRVPGVVIEHGQTTDFRGRRACPVIVSLCRLIDNTSPELEAANLGVLGDKIKSLIFRIKSCPIYSFNNNSDSISGVVGNLNWHDELYRDPPPSLQPVGYPELGGWVRDEYRFVVHYTTT